MIRRNTVCTSSFQTVKKFQNQKLRAGIFKKLTDQWIRIYQKINPLNGLLILYPGESQLAPDSLPYEPLG